MEIIFGKIALKTTPDIYLRHINKFSTYGISYHNNHLIPWLGQDNSKKEVIAANCATTKAQAKHVVDTIGDLLREDLVKNGKTSYFGLGNLNVVERGEREGRNLQDGSLIKIQAKKVVKFRPSTMINRAVNRSMIFMGKGTSFIGKNTCLNKNVTAVIGIGISCAGETYKYLYLFLYILFFRGSIEKRNI
jgi:DNA-binding protein HU-beta